MDKDHNQNIKKALLVYKMEDQAWDSFWFVKVKIT